ncbi:N-acetylglucosamine-6-phosphate deacetylase [Shouchella lehensis]|uniref:N-acetylglucosamine-6-phosphate deacetylase n=1 Tax=Shouchella lehensis TaxID=300825 RepID=A0A4Y7WIK2_9BACI|nr:N-acetylglucosamine-6-phosphate deacetylase [Shouchella lehensis]RQW19747.1 N-acetylglucosamine-6-phosphate deacetylase [Bacillus sp. C1-1]TES47935.1 N-acetylglucosamine-6-phosphate deacetylase [Shouchella lehensis]
MAELLIKGKQMVSGIPNETKCEGFFVAIEAGKIIDVGIGDASHLTKTNTTVVSLSDNQWLVPGFVDLHIHGGYGVDVMDHSDEGLQHLKQSLTREGTTSFLATTITQSISSIEEVIHQVTVHPNQGGAEIVGLHIEGPFINEVRKGAQPAQYIVDPAVELMKKWTDLAPGKIKQVTYAPEKPGGLELTTYLRKQAINPSIGHSDAHYDEIALAIDNGLNQATHLFNGMRPLHHREPGVVGTALLRDELDVELIADGIHIHPHMIQLAWKVKGTNRCLLITDSMRAKGLSDGMYELGGQDVQVKDGQATLEDGSLAGSILPMNEAITNMINFSGCTFEEAIQMATYNPARKINVLDRKGTIEVGKDADLVIWEDGKVVSTFCKGSHYS